MKKLIIVFKHLHYLSMFIVGWMMIIFAIIDLKTGLVCYQTNAVIMFGVGMLLTERAIEKEIVP